MSCLLFDWGNVQVKQNSFFCSAQYFAWPLPILLAVPVIRATVSLKSFTYTFLLSLQSNNNFLIFDKTLKTVNQQYKTPRKHLKSMTIICDNYVHIKKNVYSFMGYYAVLYKSPVFKSFHGITAGLRITHLLVFDETKAWHSYYYLWLKILWIVLILSAIIEMRRRWIRIPPKSISKKTFLRGFVNHYWVNALKGYPLLQWPLTREAGFCSCRNEWSFNKRNCYGRNLRENKLMSFG